MMELPAFKDWFEPRFEASVESCITRFSRYSTSGAVSEIAEYIQRVARGGKRLRPYLAYVGYLTHGGDPKKVEALFPIFTAIELVHLFALVHDDVMDEAQSRHGVSTMHTYFGEKYHHKRIGESIAILAGDVVLNWAYRAMQTLVLPMQVMDEFEILIEEVIHGQLIDVLSPVVLPQSDSEIIEKMTLKTAHYSFYRPLMIGALVGGKGIDQQFLKMYTTNLGIAFQIQDDLLDIVPQSETGKSMLRDIQNGQQTLVTWYMEHKASESDRELYGEALNAKNDVALRDVFIESGAVRYVQECAEQYFQNARDAVRIHATEQEIWNDLIALVARRKK